MNVKTEVIKIINETVEDIVFIEAQADSDLRELGMDSISFIQIIVQMEETFGCEIPDSKLLMAEMNTLNKILNTLWEIGVYDKA
jgi:acyl carrier protein